MNLKNKSLRIAILIILILFCTFGLACYLNQHIKYKYFGFQKLSKDSIENIVIYKFEPDSLNYCRCNDSITLTDNQIKLFVRKWNNSYPIGACKFIPTFSLTVRLRNGNIRKFSYIDRCLKENSYGYKFLYDGKFISKMWGN